MTIDARPVLVRVFAAMMVGAIVAAGALRLSFWTVPPFALIIALAFSAQKTPQWRAARARDTRPSLALKVAGTLLVHACFAGLFYASAFAIAAATTDANFVASPFGVREVAALVACAASGALAFLVRATPRARFRPGARSR